MGLEKILVLVIPILAFYLMFRRKRTRQLAYIDDYEFHPLLHKKLKQKYPHLSEQNIEFVFETLRDYFRFCNQRGNLHRFPSQAGSSAKL